MQLHYRLATKNDVDFLLSLERDSFPEFQQSQKNQILRSVNSKSQVIFIVENAENSTAVGSIVLYRYKYAVRIFSIALVTSTRKLGLGKEIMEFIKDYSAKNDFLKITLEVRTKNENLVTWYKNQDFTIVKTLADYYRTGENAYKMKYDIEKNSTTKSYKNIIIIDKPFTWDDKTTNAAIVSVKDFITKDIYQNNANYRVFNLCSSYKYQSYGYFVSLLASARGQRIVPNIATISDFKNSNVVQSFAYDISSLLNKTLKKETQNSIEFDVFFGETKQKKYKELASKMYQIFEAPLFKVSLIKDDVWLVKNVRILTFKKLNSEQKQLMYQFANRFFNKKRYNFPSLTSYIYDLAVLVNPNEENPPSDKLALEKLKTIANKKGVYVEFITKKDKDKINEFDALFIRETTNVNHHTYEFSRLAYAEGLVVMDDPWSILRCSNKIFQDELFRKNKINTPKTQAITKNHFTKDDVKNFQYPLILKQPDSAFSLGVSKVNSPKEALEKITQLFKISDMVICQEFLYSDFDWRIGILDNKPLYACKYYMTKDHWQIYDWNSDEEDKSGNFETLPISEVPKNVLETALEAASLIGDGLYGIDLKEINGETYVIEVNDNPNIDAGVEDAHLNEELYKTIIDSFIQRIELSKNIRKIDLSDVKRSKTNTKET